MKVSFEAKFIEKLNNQVRYISKDKPQTARKFKSDLIKKLRKDLKQPFHSKKSIYYNDENIRDCVFKGYTCVYKIDLEQDAITVFGFIKHKESL
ncbi:MULTISPECIES: type II toxin-antitoxin system RelE/ParE family toxin [unclassified Flavobacterium]|jgi:mRNA-degrading endonuclease RelE of RelBE toxin-antitoxin system|uniref:type II toxin-antitoxin system RelE/ParE family toxin n=1 Tax=unclassified Flavobacterium TaxID=196869 RepID=UPI0025C1F011|nr:MULTISPECIES: type II toxin-antitoxin system RelE/ParE family toxin [unclassified Flavobacterium]